MNFLKRLSITMRSQLDEAIGQIENHDAIIAVTLQEQRESLARLNLELSRVRKSIGKIDAQIQQHEHAIQTWTQRAKDRALNDEEMAIACLERRDACCAQIQLLQQKQQQYARLEDQLMDDIAKLEAALSQDEHRLHEFRSRDLTARLQRDICKSDMSHSSMLEQAFERWELDIIRTESSADPSTVYDQGLDPLECELRAQERREARRLELDELKKELGHDNP